MPDQLAIAGDRLCRIPEVANHLACSRATVYRLIRTGQLSSIKVLADQRVPAGSVAEYIFNNTHQNKGV